MPGRIGMKPSGSTASLLIGCLLLCCSQHCRRVEAYPQFAAEIPNALAVPHPTTPGIRCSALGHEDCVPGSKSLNSFGRAFQAAGFKWTPSLCAEDSDGEAHKICRQIACCTIAETVNNYPQVSKRTAPAAALHTDRVVHLS